MPPLLDPSRPDDAHGAARLSAEPIAWLGTTRPDGRPHHVPVWFSWQDPTALVFSGAAAQKVRNIRLNPAVTLTLDSADEGRDIVIVEGRAELLDESEVRAGAATFAEKYAARLRPSSFDEWAASFPQPVLITATRVMLWTRTEEGLHFRAVM